MPCSSTTEDAPLLASANSISTDHIDWAAIFQLAQPHKKILVQAHVIALLAAVILVPVPMLMPLLVDEVLLDQPGILISLLDSLFPESWLSASFYIIIIMVATIFLRLVGTLLSVWQTRDFTLVAKDVTTKQPKFGRADLQPFLQSLFTALFGIVDNVEWNENDYVMKCVMNHVLKYIS